MGHNWIIDVLADLESFAQQNGLPYLAHELSKTAEVATAEIKASTGGAPTLVQEDAERLQQFLSGTGESRTA